MNALEKLVDVLTAVILMFLVPLLYYGGGRNISRTVFAGQAGENFLKQISTAGEITLPVWEELEKALEGCGCDGFEVQRKRILFEPASEEGNVIERVERLCTEDLTEQIREKGKIRLLKGDRILLTIYVNGFPTVHFTRIRTGEEMS